MAEGTPWVIDVTIENFQEEVITRSNTVPVVIDFWAEWCVPCRQLAPILENLAREYDGKFVLAKINIDEQQQLAGAFQIQSIPTVVAFVDEQPVDQFQRVMPEESIREWLSQFLPSRTDELITEARAIEESDMETAQVKYREALELTPGVADAEIALARIALRQNRDEEAKTILAKLEKRGFLEPEAEQVKAELELREASADSGGLDEARAAADANPEDLKLQLQLADALAVARQFDEACEICLKLFAEQKAEVGDEAKETLLRIFELMGHESPDASRYRRRLASLMY